MSATRAIFEVTAGVVPGHPEDVLTRRWAIPADLEPADERERTLEAAGAALLYAASLQDPSRLNWVRLDWVWL